MFIHDLIKIKYINEGYLPNYPYYQITDKEMFSAFWETDAGYFDVNYPLIGQEFKEAYDLLVTSIKYHTDAYLNDGTEIPDWVYAYMSGNVIGQSSADEDVSDLEELLNIKDNESTQVTFDLEDAEECYKVSKDWVVKYNLSDTLRPPTMFGEPHVIKSLRIASSDVLG